MDKSSAKKPTRKATPSKAKTNRAKGQVRKQSLQFAKIAREEQDVTIQLLSKPRGARIYAAWPMMIRRLIRRYGPPAWVTTARDGKVTSAFWDGEFGWIGFRGPGRRPHPGNPASLQRARQGQKKPSLPPKR